MPQGTKLENVELWFQDEARIGQQGTITRMWAEKGTRPRALKQLQYDYAYIFGAVCAEKDDAVALVISSIGTEAMIEHLRLISEKVAPGKIAVVVFDRASWHTTQKINIFPNLRFLALPAASPELNPVEQLWQQLRDNSLANRVYKNFFDIQDACCEAWNSFVNRKGAIKKLCTRKWAIVN